LSQSTRSQTKSDRSTSIARLRRLAWLLDASFRIPFTQFRFGFDALIGLIPGVGDVAGAGMSAYVVFRAWREGVGSAKLAKMIGNVLVETAVGVVPILGDVFDAAYKSNLRNVKILLEELETSARPAEDRRGARAGAIWLGAGVFVAVLLSAVLVASLVVGVITLFR
jgi:hypothetical protein